MFKAVGAFAYVNGFIGADCVLVLAARAHIVLFFVLQRRSRPAMTGSNDIARIYGVVNYTYGKMFFSCLYLNW